MARLYPNLLERLFAKCGKVSSTGCWMWLGHCDAKGYGKMTIRVNGKPVGFRTHRLMYELVNGPIPPGLALDHKDDICLGGACMNPDHLEIVTTSENSKRVRRREREGREKAYKHENHKEGVASKRAHV
jgi:hypothetical protein